MQVLPLPALTHGTCRASSSLLHSEAESHVLCNVIKADAQTGGVFAGIGLAQVWK